MAGNRLKNKKSPLAVARFGGLNQKTNLKIPENDDFYKRNPQTSADLKKEVGAWHRYATEIALRARMKTVSVMILLMRISERKKR